MCIGASAGIVQSNLWFENENKSGIEAANYLAIVSIAPNAGDGFTYFQFHTGICQTIISPIITLRKEA
jgi:hypothetical protein